MKTKPLFDGEIHAVSAKTTPDINRPKREPGWFLGEPAEALQPQTSEASVEAIARVIYESAEAILRPNFWDGWSLTGFAKADERTRNVHHVMARAVIAALAKPASEPAGGGVRDDSNDWYSGPQREEIERQRRPLVWRQDASGDWSALGSGRDYFVSASDGPDGVRWFGGSDGEDRDLFPSAADALNYCQSLHTDRAAALSSPASSSPAEADRGPYANAVQGDPMLMEMLNAATDENIRLRKKLAEAEALQAGVEAVTEVDPVREAAIELLNYLKLNDFSADAGRGAGAGLRDYMGDLERALDGFHSVEVVPADTHYQAMELAASRLAAAANTLEGLGFSMEAARARDDANLFHSALDDLEALSSAPAQEDGVALINSGQFGSVDEVEPEGAGSDAERRS